MNARILVVEDEPALARGLCDNFRAEGYEVALVERGDLVLAEIAREKPDLVVLDLMLPGRNGLDVLRDLRARDATTPVLVLTARSEVVDRVVGLELGADDYLGKPFAVRELIARVQALLRRARHQPGPDLVEIGRARFDLAGLLAWRDGVPVELTAHAFGVLRALLQRRGAVLSRADIVEEVSGLDSEATLRTVDNHVVALRRAIEDDPRRPRLIATVRGLGYRLEREP